MKDDNGLVSQGIDERPADAFSLEVGGFGGQASDG